MNEFSSQYVANTQVSVIKRLIYSKTILLVSKGRAANQTFVSMGNVWIVTNERVMYDE